MTFRRLLISALVSFCSYGISISDAKPLIIYTGTFDPYHRNHHEQVEAALEAIPNAEARIGVVELSPPSVVTAKSKVELPTLFSYAQRKDIIKAAIAGDPRISVTDDFRYIPVTKDKMIVPGMAAIMSKIQEHHDGPIYRLVGTDVFLLWLADNEFKYWPESVRFIIGYNPELHEEFFELQKKFENNSRFVFVRKQNVQIRSSQLRSELLNKRVDWNDFLTESSAQKMSSKYSNEELVTNLLDRHEYFLQKYLTEEVLPLLSRKTQRQLPNTRIRRLDWLQQIAKSYPDDEKLMKSFFRARRSMGLIPNVINYLNQPVVSCRLSLLL